MGRWMGEIFYRGVNPSNMGYAELKFYSKWHNIAADAERGD